MKDVALFIASGPLDFPIDRVCGAEGCDLLIRHSALD